MAYKILKPFQAKDKNLKLVKFSVEDIGKPSKVAENLAESTLAYLTGKGYIERIYDEKTHKEELKTDDL